jgi:hypothetical protein
MVMVMMRRTTMMTMTSSKYFIFYKVDKMLPAFKLAIILWLFSLRFMELVFVCPVADIHFAGTMGTRMCNKQNLLQSSRWPDNVALHFGSSILRVAALPAPPLLSQHAEAGISHLPVSSK